MRFSVNPNPDSIIEYAQGYRGLDWQSEAGTYSALLATRCVSEFSKQLATFGFQQYSRVWHTSLTKPRRLRCLQQQRTHSQELTSCSYQINGRCLHWVGRRGPHGLTALVLQRWYESYNLAPYGTGGRLLLTAPNSRDTKSRTKIKNPAPINFRYCPVI